MSCNARPRTDACPDCDGRNCIKGAKVIIRPHLRAREEFCKFIDLIGTLESRIRLGFWYALFPTFPSPVPFKVGLGNVYELEYAGSAKRAVHCALAGDMHQDHRSMRVVVSRGQVFAGCEKGRYVRVDEEVCKVVKVDPDGLLHVLRGRLR